MAHGLVSVSRIKLEFHTKRYCPVAHRLVWSLVTLGFAQNGRPTVVCRIISRLILVILSHLTISACVMGDQLASCTRHGHTNVLCMGVS